MISDIILILLTIVLIWYGLKVTGEYYDEIIKESEKII